MQEELTNLVHAILQHGIQLKKRLLRGDRRKLKDEKTQRRMLRAAYLFAGSILLVLAAVGGVIAVGGETADTTGISLALSVGLLFVVAATVNALVWFVRFRLSYRCPECGARPLRVDEALPDVHFYCPACNVEWDTGVQEQGSTS